MKNRPIVVNGKVYSVPVRRNNARTIVFAVLLLSALVNMPLVLISCQSPDTKALAAADKATADANAAKTAADAKAKADAQAAADAKVASDKAIAAAADAKIAADKAAAALAAAQATMPATDPQVIALSNANSQYQAQLIALQGQYDAAQKATAAANAAQIASEKAAADAVAKQAAAEKNYQAAVDTYNANTEKHKAELAQAQSFAGMVPTYGTIAVAMIGAFTTWYGNMRGKAVGHTQGVTDAASAVAIGQAGLTQTPPADPAINFDRTALVDLLVKLGVNQHIIDAFRT